MMFSYNNENQQYRLYFLYAKYIYLYKLFHEIHPFMCLVDTFIQSNFNFYILSVHIFPGNKTLFLGRVNTIIYQFLLLLLTYSHVSLFSSVLCLEFCFRMPCQFKKKKKISFYKCISTTLFLFFESHLSECPHKKIIRLVSTVLD